MLAALLPLAAAFTAETLPRGAVAPRAAVTRMFDLSPKNNPTPEDVVIKTVTRSREVGSGRSGAIVVTDDSGLYGSRTVFQQLYDFGNYASIVACSESTAQAKKVLLSRNSRYSGLLDVLDFHEGAPEGAFAGADAYLAINPPEYKLAGLVQAASSAGVKRIFLLLSDLLADPAGLDAALASSGMQYTVMRTGTLVDGVPEGSGLKLDELDMAVCEDVPKDDVFRFVTEALTLEEAHGRSFSLCPSAGTVSTLKEMRLCGYERRDEVKLLLNGMVKEDAVEAALTEEEKEEAQELVLRSEAEVAAEREEELKMLLERARQKGIETQQRLAFEEKEKAEARAEAAKYYSSDNTKGDDDGTPPADDAAPDATPDAPPAA